MHPQVFDAVSEIVFSTLGYRSIRENGALDTAAQSLREKIEALIHLEVALHDPASGENIYGILTEEPGLEVQPVKGGLLHILVIDWIDATLALNDFGGPAGACSWQRIGLSYPETEALGQHERFARLARGSTAKRRTTEVCALLYVFGLHGCFEDTEAEADWWRFAKQLLPGAAVSDPPPPEQVIQDDLNAARAFGIKNSLLKLPQLDLLSQQRLAFRFSVIWVVIGFLLLIVYGVASPTR